MKTLLIALLLFPLAANATDWTIYNGTTNTCQSAVHAAEQTGVPEFISPFDLRAYLRMHSGYGYEGFRTRSGPNGVVVEIKSNYGKTNIFYFSKRSMCEQAAKNVENTPHHNINELR
jgi:hypothetical protein